MINSEKKPKGIMSTAVFSLVFYVVYLFMFKIMNSVKKLHISNSSALLCLKCPSY